MADRTGPPADLPPATDPWAAARPDPAPGAAAPPAYRPPGAVDAPRPPYPAGAPSRPAPADPPPYRPPAPGGTSPAGRASAAHPTAVRAAGGDEPTTPSGGVPTGPAPWQLPGSPSYHRGRAVVGASAAPPPMQTTSEYPPELRDEAERVLGPTRPPRAVRRQQLRRGGAWTWFGGIFAFICWGVWAISTRGGGIAAPALGLATLVVVALGVFGLSRLVGSVVLERGLGRTRHSAWGAHLITGAFCVATGVAYLGQTPWLVDVWKFLRGLG
ncbi:hypothetical protein GCM10010123_24510 [Pilimelia anulata]|uniref:Uncharacterized protein n=1 Tax=Pilimelia anulata TaxID=53371 RepID=A0A8J3F9H5_9ACTN|nr:hypothetical protein [Pilimelia anulata]GGJ93778.1 hypothetical protein GCM10010123_24510 [Pilimelia anulata]